VQAFAEFQRLDPVRAGRLAAAVASLPEVGASFAGFYLLSELGRGAFARVFLARQADLAGRLVALKVAPGNDGSEARKLAQLQHTNVVPVYSLHREGRLQAVCMPYFGSTTLGHVLDGLKGGPSLPASGHRLLSTLQGRRSTQLNSNTGSATGARGLRTGDGGQTDGPAAPRPPSAAPLSPPAPASTATLEMLEKFSYVEAVLWLGARLADGLGHAHERGILHRDIKPQNVLLTDEGQPMLLDFNLAEDEKDTAAGVKAQMGGTLPYMAPEHLEAFRKPAHPVDARADLYGLGVILFELLAGKPPFETRHGLLSEVVEGMIADRRVQPSLPRLNPAVSPAVGAIIAKLLAFDPAGRYQSARQLQEDLDRQLSHRPLQHAPNPSWRELAAKWRRRHPRLNSTFSITALAAVALATLAAGLLSYRRELAHRDAAAGVAQSRPVLLAAEYHFLPTADRLAEPGRGDLLARAVLDRYGVGTDPDWLSRPALAALTPEERDRWRTDLGQMLLLQAAAALRHARAGQDAPAAETGLWANRKAEACFPDAPALLFEQRAELLTWLGHTEEAQAARAHAAELAGRPDPFGQVLRLAQRAGEERHGEAIPALRDLTDREPTNSFAWLILGYCYFSTGDHTRADSCYSTCIALQPEIPWPYMHRGLSRLEKREFLSARADFDRATDLAPDLAGAYLSRALTRERTATGVEAAIADLDAALRRNGPAAHIHLLKSRMYADIGNQVASAREEAEALRTEPAALIDWVSRSQLLIARKDYPAALVACERALAINPRALDALRNKAHILSERLPRPAEARAALDRLVELYPDFLEARSGRGVLLARLGETDAARRDARHCLESGQRLPPLILYQLACLYAQSSRHDPADRGAALDLLRRAFRDGFDRTDLLDELLDHDEDLNPLFGDAEFRRITRAARDLFSHPRSG
jgi:serine/threonine protein kinase/Flp pilus assembly protein TadD